MSLIVIITFLAAAVVGFTARAARNSRKLDERLAARYATRRERTGLGMPDGAVYGASFGGDATLGEPSDVVYEPAGPKYTPDTIATARRAVRPAFGIQIRVKP